MQILFIKNPIIRKRLRRFRQKKRAWVSFLLLIIIYIISLGSELIANDKPLYVRFSGKNYFPVFRFYPENTFLNNGRLTRPDYKAIRSMKVFTNTPGNYMVFPPIPYGPYENINPGSLIDSNRTIAVIQPQPHVGNINIDTNMNILRATACGYFFSTNDHDVTGLDLANHWDLNETLKQAIQTRFANQPDERKTFFISSAENNNRSSAEITLSSYRPRSRSPRSIRLTFREPQSPQSTHISEIHFDRNGTPLKTTPFFDALSAADRQNLSSLARKSFTQSIVQAQTTLKNEPYVISITPHSIQWPYHPVPGHWLGIDSSGRDVLVRIIYGFRTSMTFGLLLVAGALLLGTIVGAIQGYFAGLTDITMQRLIEIWSALPFLYIMILIGSIYGRSFSILLFCYGLFNWIGISYYIRAEFLRLRKYAFVDAARCMGIPAQSIMFRHILPNALTPIITFFPFSLVGAISALAALDYLGFGLPPPTPSWGELFHQAQTFRWAWWLILYPALALFTVMLLGVFIGEGIRDAFDPKPYSRIE